jgi:hypothetical protein
LFAGLADVGGKSLGFFFGDVDADARGAGEVLELLGGFQDVLLALFSEAGDIAELFLAG